MTLPIIRADAGDLIWILIMVGVAIANAIGGSKKKKRAAEAARQRALRTPEEEREDEADAAARERQLREFLESLGAPVAPAPPPPPPRPVMTPVAQSAAEVYASTPPPPVVRRGVPRPRREAARPRPSQERAKPALTWSHPPLPAITPIEELEIPDLSEVYAHRQARMDIGGLPLSALSMSLSLPPARLSGVNVGVDGVPRPDLRPELSDARAFRRALIAQAVLGPPAGWPRDSVWPCGARP